MGKLFSLLSLLMIAVFCFGSIAMAEIDWNDMTDEEICSEIEKAQGELGKRRIDSSSIELGVPFYIEKKDGLYLFTIENAHILNSERWKRAAIEHAGDDCIIISVQGIIENVSYDDWDGKIGYTTFINDISVIDQDGFTLESYNISGGDDGKYEVGAFIRIGEKARVSLPYYAYIDTETVTIKVPEHEGEIFFSLR
ncbi:MAG: hypothetical protein IJI26_04810 [Clostridia bacterium]|nr:hypothetical protein [Clostridia bacterium]